MIFVPPQQEKSHPRKMDTPVTGKKGRQGFAIMYAFSCILLISFIVVSLSKETLIDYRISAKAVEKIKAYTAAQSGIEISMLRIQIYRTALARFGKMLEDPQQKAMLDMIWSLPLPWPPVLGEETNRVDKELLKSAVDKSLLDTSYLATIEDEGTKIDINDLGSQSKAMQKATQQQILNLFLAKMESDEDFKERNSRVDFDEVINNITDWVDEDEESLNGGAEGNYYDFSRSSGVDLPPNRAFRTIQELKMVSGLSSDLFSVLEPRITVYGTKGINVNHASKEVLMSLSTDMTDEKAQQIVTRRADPVLGPFATVESFVNYASSELGITIETEGENAIPILVDAVVNFKIRSQGIYKSTTREIVAVIYDFDKVRDRLVEIVQKEEPDDPNPTPTPTPTPTPAASDPNAPPPGPRGRPRVVFWKVL